MNNLDLDKQHKGILVYKDKMGPKNGNQGAQFCTTKQKIISDLVTLPTEYVRPYLKNRSLK